MKPRKGVYKNCLYCKEQFYIRQSLKDRLFCKQDHYIAYVKDLSFYFHCLVCQKKVSTQPIQMKLRNRKHCSRTCESVTKRAKAEKRRKGYTKHQLDRLSRYSPEMAVWRKSVFERDGYTCQMCGVKGGYLEADHIKPFAYFPELRTELTNGRTLCRPCHDTTKLPYQKLREKWKSELKRKVIYTPKKN